MGIKKIISASVFGIGFVIMGGSIISHILLEFNGLNNDFSIWSIPLGFFMILAGSLSLNSVEDSHTP